MVQQAPLKLSVVVSPAAGWSYDELLAHAAEAERAGLWCFWVSDHFFTGDGPPDVDCLEAWTLLAALARDTRTIRLGTLVTAHSYRNPALLAKIVATVDRLSDGRVEFGIGAGWKENEYRAYGYEFPPPGRRVSELEEALQICLRLWTEERVTYRGAHYTVEDAVCAPKPVQRPHPPVWVGGSKPRIMRVAARLADGFNIGRRGQPPRVPDAEQLAAVRAELDAAARAVRRERPLRVSHWTPMEIGDGASARALVGQARALAAGGIEELQLSFPRAAAIEMTRRAAREVLPALT